MTRHKRTKSPIMSTQNLLRRLLFLRTPPRAAERVFATARSQHASAAEEEPEKCVADKWFALPPYTATASATVLGKRIAGAEKDSVSLSEASESTALKWIIRCCPDIPRNLVQKLFRLRQVRRECSETEVSDAGDQPRKPRLRRVGAKDSMNLGDRILLPITVKERPVAKKKFFCGDDEIGFIRSLVLHKDSEIIVVNKPPGMPVQGGIGIRTSLDELAISCLSYGSPEPPRLVHRLDKDCSGILVMGRTQTSATVLHSVFREKTFGASNDETVDEPRALTRKYWALVFGSPRRPKGLISAPLAKVVLDNGKADRITVVNNSSNSSSQHAVTEYKVIGSSSHGYTWLELSPLTGRKHQLRVHCAEVLGTPIVGDYKYGWQAHRNWKPLCLDGPEIKGHQEEIPNMKNLPFGLSLENGSVTEKQPRLHLHCKQLVLPNISKALEHAKLHSDYDLSQIQSLKFDAPMPLYMQTSWDIINSQGTY